LRGPPTLPSTLVNNNKDLPVNSRIKLASRPGFNNIPAMVVLRQNLPIRTIRLCTGTSSGVGWLEVSQLNTSSCSFSNNNSIYSN